MAERSAQISLSLLVGIIVCLRPSLSAVLYDYGESAGDIKVTKGRDVAQQVEFSVNFLRMPFETLYISTKGAILFDTPAEPQSRMIAPFYADIDNSKKGRIWYRTSSKEDDLSRAGEEMSRYFPSRKFTPTNILVVTWENVCIQRNRGLTKGITFQAVIITDHHYTFVEFIYSDGNDFPRASSIPVSPVIGFSSSNVEFFDYAVAEETAVVFEKTKSSNVNEEGLWAFQIDGIDPYDIIWGIPEGGNIQGDEAINDGDTDLNINVGLVGDDCSSCAATGSSCVDYGAGSCCVCNVNYMGNGISCLRNETNKPYRANGVIRGTVNGDELPGMNVHAFIIASEGRTYTAVSPTPEGLNYTLQLILPIAETIAWLFAVPKNKGLNGMTATGGSFSATSRLRFNTGEELTVEEEYMITGESIRATINLDGTLPLLEEKSLRVDESTAVFTRHRPGIIHSYETRRVFTDSSEIVFTLEKTIHYSDCLADEVDFDLILNSMSLQYSSVNVFHEEEHPNLRFSLRSSISPTSELVRDPCDINNCHTYAVCLPDADSYRCQCFEGFVGDGFSCEEEIIDPCQENACDENAECSPLDRTYTCTCYPGYTGDGFICKEAVVDPCESNQCSVNADCTPSGSRYYCTCREGYEGDGVTCTREVVDPCESNQCSVNADCTPSGGRYYCTCREGYEGDGVTCTREVVDPCESNQCSVNADCTPSGGRYYCTCREGYEGDGVTCTREVVDPCESNQCSVNADCTPSGGRYYCTCREGYEGDGVTCTREVIDPCESNRCSVNAECTPSGSRYYCTCQEGYEGDGVTCTREVVDPCESNQCSVDADCTPSGSRYYCTCREGYEGDGVTCTREVVDPCESNQCSVNADCTAVRDRYICTCKDGYEGNGIDCRAASRGPCDANRCHPNAICTPEGRTYYCQCEPGFEGDGFDCEEAQVNQCEGNRCDANAVCFPDRNSYICECVSGFEGNGYICEEIFMDPCLENDCNPFARCIPNESVYDCECLAGYEGDGYTCVSYPCRSNECDVNADCFASRDGRNYECRCKDGYAGDGFECEDNAVDVCEDNECDRNGECVPLVNSYDCQCLDGFLGNGFFCIAEDPCYENSCHGNADCSPLGDGYRCTCGDGYQGDGYSCQDIDECSISVSPCDRNADCTNTYGSYRCSCLEGFEGDGTSCQDIDECSTSISPCDRNAYCTNTFGYYACTCREGFIGDGTSCQASVRPSGDGMLLYGQGKAVMKMPLDPNEEGARVIHKKRQTIVGLAYDCEDDVIYFTDVAKGSISRVKPDGTGYKRLIVKGISSPEGVAVDHISRNLYWTDSGFDRIEVANLDGQNRRALVTTDLTNPRSIVLDPVYGYLYWTDWNRDGPKIERSFMDGNGREVLVSDGLQLPNGLTIDYISQKICWADAGSEKVECIGVDGDPLTHTTVFAQADYPFGLAAFDQNLYWTDWTMNSVFSVNKNGALSADEMSLPHGGTGRLYGIIAAQECSPGSNACASNNGGCSALCLPAPRGARTCACPTDARGNEIPC